MITIYYTKPYIKYIIFWQLLCIHLIWLEPRVQSHWISNIALSLHWLSLQRRQRHIVLHELPWRLLPGLSPVCLHQESDLAATRRVSWYQSYKRSRKCRTHTASVLCQFVLRLIKFRIFDTTITCSLPQNHIHSLTLYLERGNLGRNGQHHGLVLGH